jgi:hypothetical protein
MSQGHGGVDVAKDRADGDHPVADGERIAQPPAAVEAFAQRCAETAVRVVFEATGGDDRLPAEASAAAVAASMDPFGPGSVRPEAVCRSLP